MKKKKVLGIALIVVGVVFLGISHYIKEQVAAGTLQIAGAQRSVNAGKSLFSLSPQTQSIGNIVTGPAQRKIDAGSEEIAYYSSLANGLQVVGIVCLLGGAYVLIRFRKS